MANTPSGGHTAETPSFIHSHLSNSAPTDAFVEFVQKKKHKYKGRNGHGEEQHYLPRSELFAYWDISRIRSACESYSEDITIRPSLVREHYLCIFSTLVYIGQLSFLPAFKRFDLTDERFPDNTPPGVWENSPFYIPMFNIFQRNQWMFFPLKLDRDRLDDTSLPPERILPLCFEETIRSKMPTDRASITKVCFHPSCDNLFKDDGTATENPAYILKTYHGVQHEQHYQHEVKAFTRLPHNNSSTGHIVKCHATFRQGDSYNLIMQFVAGGDLLEYFRKTSPPRTAEEIIDFWDSLTKLTVGLHHLHQVVVRGERSEEYQLVHQDIKPDNILLDVHPESNPYQFSPIIADLGHSHTRHITDGTSEIPAVDRRGNQMYCAPESSHHAGFRRTGPNRIKSDADIFSAGAVLSDAASWVAKGEGGRQEYMRRRRHELDNTEGFINSGYETAFHNGFERLPCVDVMHCDIRSSVPSCDNITHRVLDIIEKHMMVLPNERLEAKLLCGKFEQQVRNARSELLARQPGLEESQIEKEIDLSKLHDALPEVETPPPSSTATNIWSPTDSATRSTSTDGYSTDGYSDSQDMLSPVGSPTTPTEKALLGFPEALFSTGVASPIPTRPEQLRRPLTTPNPPALARHISRVSEDALRSISETGIMLSMKDAANYRKAKKMNERVNSRVEKVIQNLIDNLEQRDHLFLIDDTESMKEHSLEIEESFQTLAYIAKSIDPDALELSFVSKPLAIIKNKHTSPLVNELRQHLRKHVSVKGRIESSLSTLVTEKIMKRLPYPMPFIGHVPTWSKPITIFVFTDGKWGDGIRVGNGLDTPILHLMRKMNNRGLNRTHVMFQFLRFGNDQEGIRHLAHLDSFGKKEKWDIVDTRDINGDVYAMFLATLTEHNDINNDGSPTGVM